MGRAFSFGDRGLSQIVSNEGEVTAVDPDQAHYALEDGIARSVDIADTLAPSTDSPVFTNTNGLNL